MVEDTFLITSSYYRATCFKKKTIEEFSTIGWQWKSPQFQLLLVDAYRQQIEVISIQFFKRFFWIAKKGKHGIGSCCYTCFEKTWGEIDFIIACGILHFKFVNLLFLFRISKYMKKWNDHSFRSPIGIIFRRDLSNSILWVKLLRKMI